MGLQFVEDLLDENVRDPWTRSLGKVEGITQLLDGVHAASTPASIMRVATMQLEKKSAGD